MKVCRQCGTEVFDGEEFCYSCGYIGEPVECVHEPLSRQSEWTAILLAIIPGFFDVFGLGQLYLRSYLKAGLFMLSSALLFLAVNHFDIIEKDSLIHLGVRTGLFFIQAMDVMVTTIRRRRVENV